MATSRSELETIIRLSGNVDPSLRRAMLDAQERMEELGEASDKAGKFMSGAFGIAAKAAASGAAAFVAVGVKGVALSEEFNKSMNGLQAQTGISADKMAEYEDITKRIYNNNFGESFDDIAKSMAIVKTTTGLTGNELEKLTTNALLLRDTFELEVNESVRSADKLMRHFGITGDNVMALVAEGTQKGLNFADDLLPTIDEYSVYFKQAGFSASEMFGLFENAKAAGVFNLDYAADAVKEFGIRMTQEGDDTAKTLNRMGLDGAGLTEQFAKGGEGAKQAFRITADALSRVVSKQDQVALGVKLFGTKFEDVGAKGVLAMTQVNDSIKGSAELLEDINKIKYDTFGEAVAGIGRKLNTGLLIPLGDKLLPKMNELAAWVVAHMPEIHAAFETAFNAAGTAIEATIDAAKSLIGFIEQNWTIIEPLIYGIVGAMIAWKAITVGMAIYKGIMAGIRAGTVAAALAQWGLNAAVLANPITWVVVGIAAAIGVVVSGIFLLWKHWDDISAFMIGLWQNNVLPFFQGVGDWFGGLWTGMVDGFKTAWSGVSSWFSGLWDGILSVFKGFINLYFTPINLLIDALNNIKINVPDWVPIYGGKSFGIDIPNIPTFAEGGFTNQPSIFGEAGPEAAIPLKRTPRSLSLLSQTASALGVGGGGGGSANFSLNVNVNGSAGDSIKSQVGEAATEFFDRCESWWEERKRQSFG